VNNLYSVAMTRSQQTIKNVTTEDGYAISLQGQEEILEGDDIADFESDIDT
jgi:hypothetical protein